MIVTKTQMIVLGSLLAIASLIDFIEWLCMKFKRGPDDPDRSR